METISSAFVWLAERPQEVVKKTESTELCSGEYVSSESLIYIYACMQTEGICLLYHIIKDIGESITYTAVKLFTLLYRIVLEQEIPPRKTQR